MRELLVIIGVVLIALILWDGLRRMRKKGRHGAAYQDPEELRKQAEIARELPNGGARSRPMDDRDKTDLNTRLNLRERVPMLMDPVEEDNADTETPHHHADQHSLNFDAPLNDASADDEVAPAGPAAEDEDVDDEVPEQQQPPVAAEPDQPEAEQETTASAEPEPEPEPEFQSDDRPVEELVVIHVMAPDGSQLAGSELLELLLRAGLRFGPMDIFHYRNGQGQLEFSLANCVQPGTLDPDGMAEMTTPGVTLFMQLPQRADTLTSFEHMVEMGQFLAQHLGAEMLDEQHSTITPQRIEHYRERLRNFARSQLIQAHE